MSEQAPKEAFKPDKYLTKLQGRDYLEVKWRLLWLRSDHPDATVDTELLAREGDFALFKATVSVPGRGSATGHGSETAKDFRDYIEKAETKALGRALAALGFGTQFCGDELAETPTVRGEANPVDTPVQRPSRSTQGEGQRPNTTQKRPPTRAELVNHYNALLQQARALGLAALRPIPPSADEQTIMQMGKELAARVQAKKGGTDGK